MICSFGLEEGEIMFDWDRRKGIGIFIETEVARVSFMV